MYRNGVDWALLHAIGGDLIILLEHWADGHSYMQADASPPRQQEQNSLSTRQTATARVGILTALLQVHLAGRARMPHAGNCAAAPGSHKALPQMHLADKGLLQQAGMLSCFERRQEVVPGHHAERAELPQASDIMGSLWCSTPAAHVPNGLPQVSPP